MHVYSMSGVGMEWHVLHWFAWRRATLKSHWNSTPRCKVGFTGRAACCVPCGLEQCIRPSFGSSAYALWQASWRDPPCAAVPTAGSHNASCLTLDLQVEQGEFAGLPEWKDSDSDAGEFACQLSS